MADQKTGDFYSQKPDAGMGLSEDGRPQYGDMTASGMEKLVLPSPAWEKDSGRVTEDVLAKDLPRHISRKIEQTFEAGGIYSNARPHQVFAHYRGVLEGAELADKRTLAHLDKLQAGLAEASDPKEFFTKEVKPFLSSLQAKAR